MQQYFAKNKNLELEDTDYHHIKNVMRMKKGDTIKVIWDKTIYDCKITKIADKSSFDIIAKEKIKNDDYEVAVACSLIKEQKLNYLIQKCPELGASELIFLNTERSIIKIEDKKL